MALIYSDLWVLSDIFQSGLLFTRFFRAFLSARPHSLISIWALLNFDQHFKFQNPASISNLVLHLCLRLQRIKLAERGSSQGHLQVLSIAQELQTPLDHLQVHLHHRLLTHQEMPSQCPLCHIIVVPPSLCLCLVLMVWVPLHLLLINW